VSTVSATSPKRVRRISENLVETGEVPLTAEEALALILDMDLSKNKYGILCRVALKHNSKLFPPYHHLVDAKTGSRPSTIGMTISETRASVSLQHLMDTAERIVKSLTVDEVAEFFCAEQRQTELGDFSDKHLVMMLLVPIEMRNLQTSSTI
jgi:hypothetical protein